MIGAPYDSNTATGPGDGGALYTGAVYVFVRTGQTWTPQAYLKAGRPRTGDLFGISVAVSGDTLVAGSQYESSRATGVNCVTPGDAGGDDGAPASGAAYVFVRNNGKWTEQCYLKASNAETGDSFGHSVSISGDTIIVGAHEEDSAARGVNTTAPGQADNSAPESGAAYVFTRTGKTWTQQAYLKASNADPGDAFGIGVTVAGDTAAVGAIYESSTAKGVNATTPGPNDNSGPYRGAAHVFTRDAGKWRESAYVKASDSSTFFGAGIAMAGDTLAVGASGSYGGSAYVFERSAGVWSEKAHFAEAETTNQNLFGAVVAVSPNGDRVLVGDFYDWHGGVGLSSGGPLPPNGNFQDSGSAYLYERANGSWTQRAYVRAIDPKPYTHFGVSVAISQDAIIVGAGDDDSAATGVDHMNPVRTTAAPCRAARCMCTSNRTASCSNIERPPVGRTGEIDFVPVVTT